MNIVEFVSLECDEKYNPIIHAIPDEEVYRIMTKGNTISRQLKGLKQFYEGSLIYDDVNFSGVQLVLEYWDTKQLVNVPFPQWSAKKYEKEIEESTPDTYFEWDCDMPQSNQENRMEYWRKKGTWTVPIIIIRSSDFQSSNLIVPFQLFEGHTRLSRLKILYKHKNIKIKDKHLVWIIEK